MPDKQKDPGISPLLVSYKTLLTFGSWLFLIGSLIFQVDSVIELRQGFTTHAILNVFASLLFTLGSILFVIHDSQV